jgi:proteasome lid subunit RPN8/RPN11
MFTAVGLNAEFVATLQKLNTRSRINSYSHRRINYLPTPDAINVPRSSLEEIFAHARESFPNECCGWITGDKDSPDAAGVRRAINAYEPETHPTAKDRSAQTAFVISDKDLLDLNLTLDDDVRPRIIYHSHPNGRAYFSETDKANASDPWGDGPAYPVQQIVVGIDGDRVVEARQFAWDDDAEDFVEIALFDGMDV